jgi:hypothetical protein
MTQTHRQPANDQIAGLCAGGRFRALGPLKYRRCVLGELPEEECLAVDTRRQWYWLPEGRVHAKGAL